jgi:predicted transcriptional regulator
MFRWLKSSLVGGHHLGPLETQLLRALWQRGDATVRELWEDTAIQGAYTTVMTTLDRLHKKGLLDRVLDGRAFRYRPKQTEDEYNRRTFANELEKLLSSARDTASPLSFLVDTVAQHDAKLLEKLGRVVGRKRQELRKRRKR